MLRVISAHILSVPIYFKILGIGVLVAMIFGSATLLALQTALTDHLYADLERRASTTGDFLAQELALPVLVQDRVAVAEILRRQREAAADVEYLVVEDPRGGVIAHAFPAGGPPGRRSGDGLAARNDGGRVILDLRVPILDGRAGRLRIGLSDDRIRATQRAITRSYLIVLGACLLVGHLLALLLTTILVRPIDDLTEAARRIRSGDLSARAARHHADEIGALAETFNRMMEDLRSLIGRLATLQEDERRSTARELHDHLGPSLSAALLSVETIRRAAPKASEAVADLERTVRAAIDDVRKMAFTLRPSVLDDFGLEAALQTYVDLVSRHAPYSLRFRYAGPPQGHLPGEVETAFYRIAQEGLSNASQHAQARNVSLVVIHGPDEATLVIEDDGVGFDPDAPRPAAGTGLVSMRERAALVGGTFALDAAPGRGTTLRVTAPVRGAGS